MEYKWSWERAGRVVKALTENRLVLTLIVANVLTLLVSFGVFRFGEANIEDISAGVVSSVLTTVNAIAVVIGAILEARREPKETNTN